MREHSRAACTGYNQLSSPGTLPRQDVSWSAQLISKKGWKVL